MFEGDLAVLSNKPVNSEYVQLTLAASAELLDRCHAGQFFHLLCPSNGADKPYLRRPMSIYSFLPESGELQFLYKVTGTGTRALFQLAPGDRLNVLGPLGIGFRIEEDWQHLILVARGVGLATLAPLALEARNSGKRLTAICSARTPDLLMSIDYIREMGAEVVTVTDSERTSGMQHLETVIEGLVAAPGVDAFYTCGSNRMLTLLQTLGRRHGIPGQIALEQQMACGLGMCHCCVRPFMRAGERVQLRVCREGPVFDVQEAMPW
ncbi:MAG: dihydroorotate dehydrogenase electron transfer subunit [Rhizobiaceae bacterium]